VSCCTQQSRQPMSKTGGFASSPQRCAGCQPEPSSGLSDWRRKRVKSVQFDHESIRLRTFAFSTFCSHAALMVWTATRTRVYAYPSDRGRIAPALSVLTPQRCRVPTRHPLERRQSRRQIQAALLYGRVEAAAGVHPAKARRIAVNISYQSIQLSPLQ
jgi:hypothetical protein